MSKKKGREQRFPLDRPPDGMVVEPKLFPYEESMSDKKRTSSQVSVDNSLAESDDETLPEVRDAQGNPIPLNQLTGPTDAMVDEVPVEVRRATANVQPTGVHFNFEPFEQIAALHEAGRTDEAKAVYDSLDAQSRYVYNNIRNLERAPAAEAARLADEFRKKQDSLNTPQAELAETRNNAIKQDTKEGAQKTYQRASNMLFLIDNLRGGNRETAKKGEEAWRPRVGRIQGGMHNPGGWAPQMLTSAEDMGWVADFNSLKGMINLEEAQRNAGQGGLSDGERVLMAQAASLGLERQRDEPGFGVALERMYDTALEAQQAAAQKMSGEAGGSAAPASAAAQPAASPAAPAPAPTPQAGFQVGKIYRDANDRPARFRGYQNGKPVFENVQ